VPIRFASLSLALLLALTPAAAIDLTGTWAGKLNCFAYDSKKRKLKFQDQILKISQKPGESLFAGQWLNGTAVTAHFRGFAIDDDIKPDGKGRAGITDCKTDQSSGVYWVANMNAKIDRSKGKGTLAGTTIYVLYAAVVYQCEWSLKLLDTKDPGIEYICPDVNAPN